jgi:hypothetical protein
VGLFFGVADFTAVVDVDETVSVLEAVDVAEAARRCCWLAGCGMGVGNGARLVVRAVLWEALPPGGDPRASPGGKQHIAAVSDVMV